MTKSKIYIIAGEESGDFIASKIMAQFHNYEGKKAEFFGIGGNLMQQQGLQSLFPLGEINIMGFVEILPHILRLYSRINQTITHIKQIKPNILVTVDSPGFNWQIVKRIKKIMPQLKLVHIVAPSVWAYKPGRAKKYAKIYDHLLTLLPFEPPYFTKHGLATKYIGHPFLEQQFCSATTKQQRAKFTDNEYEKIILVTPGSRLGEINRHLPVMLKALNNISETHDILVLIVQQDSQKIKYIHSYLQQKARFKYYLTKDKLSAYAACDCALAKSGTNTLEISASGAPLIICYKISPISYLLIKLLIKIKYVNLINIVAAKEVIPEYIQSEFNEENITSAVSAMLNDTKSGARQVKVATKYLKDLGFGAQEAPSYVAYKYLQDILAI